MTQYQDSVAPKQHPLIKEVFRIMEEKRTNLCIAPLFANKKDLLQYIDKIGPHVCIVQTHIDTVMDFDTDLLIQLGRLSEKHDFLLFEDRQFVDNADVVEHQYQYGIYTIADWAHLTSVRTCATDATISGLHHIGKRQERGLILSTLIDRTQPALMKLSQDQAKHIIHKHPEFTLGYVAEQHIFPNADLLHIVPIDLLQNQEIQDRRQIVLIGSGQCESQPIEHIKVLQQQYWIPR